MCMYGLHSNKKANTMLTTCWLRKKISSESYKYPVPHPRSPLSSPPSGGKLCTEVVEIIPRPLFIALLSMYVYESNIVTFAYFWTLHNYNDI